MQSAVALTHVTKYRAHFKSFAGLVGNRRKSVVFANTANVTTPAAGLNNQVVEVVHACESIAFYSFCVLARRRGRDRFIVGAYSCFAIVDTDIVGCVCCTGTDTFFRNKLGVICNSFRVSR